VREVVRLLPALDIQLVAGIGIAAPREVDDAVGFHARLVRRELDLSRERGRELLDLEVLRPLLARAGGLLGGALRDGDAGGALGGAGVDPVEHERVAAGHVPRDTRRPDERERAVGPLAVEVPLVGRIHHHPDAGPVGGQIRPVHGRLRRVDVELEGDALAEHLVATLRDIGNEPQRERPAGLRRVR
jgi:hypothetical protein